MSSWSTRIQVEARGQISSSYGRPMHPLIRPSLRPSTHTFVAHNLRLSIVAERQFEPAKGSRNSLPTFPLAGVNPCEIDLQHCKNGSRFLQYKRIFTGRTRNVRQRTYTIRNAVCPRRAAAP